MKKMNQELLHASRNGDIKKVKFLLNSGANVNVHGKDFETPIMKAIEYYNNKIVMLLIEEGAKIKTQDILGRTPYLIAMESGNREAIKILRKYTIIL